MMCLILSSNDVSQKTNKRIHGHNGTPLSNYSVCYHVHLSVQYGVHSGVRVPIDVRLRVRNP